jgi:hypothetical protein
MVFVNGKQLSQVSSAAKVTADSFYYDQSGSLVIGTDPSGKEVRASDLEQALKVVASNVTLQGFGVRRYATPVETRGALLSDAATGVLRDLVVSDNATIGMSVNRGGKVIDHVVVERNGLLGIGSNKGADLRLTNSLIRNNNYENFKTEPVAGGVKITSASNAVVKNNEVSGTVDASGLWFDVRSSNTTVVGNDLINNGVIQLEFEISTGAILADNTATGGEIGILVFDGENVDIYNNAVGGNSLFGIKVAQDGRWKSEGTSEFSLKSRNIAISNNVFGCGKTFQFYAADFVTKTPADDMKLTITGNLFNKRVSSSDPTMVGWGANDNSSITRYETPSSLASAKNSAWKNAQTTACVSLSSMAGNISGSQSVAAGLPSNVAAAVGVATGYKRVGRIS